MFVKEDFESLFNSLYENIKVIEFEDSSFWYKTDNRTDWQNHQDGSPVDFSDEEANCSILNNYTWYYYKENPINQLSAGTDGTAGTSATYVEFGLWPQTIKADNVTINENDYIFYLILLVY